MFTGRGLGAGSFNGVEVLRGKFICTGLGFTPVNG